MNLSIGNLPARVRSCWPTEPLWCGLPDSLSNSTPSPSRTDKDLRRQPKYGRDARRLFFDRAAGRVQSSRPLSSVANSSARMPATSLTRAPRHSCSLRMAATSVEIFRLSSSHRHKRRTSSSDNTRSRGLPRLYELRPSAGLASTMSWAHRPFEHGADDLAPFPCCAFQSSIGDGVQEFAQIASLDVCCFAGHQGRERAFERLLDFAWRCAVARSRAAAGIRRSAARR